MAFLLVLFIMASIEDIYEIYTRHPVIQTDTRKLKPGDLYFALKGPNFNGNAFAFQALEKGAAYAIVDEPTSGSLPATVIVVEDVLRTLQQLALFHRKRFQIPFIAITGSNGKTTTKELVHAVLSQSFQTYTTEGNLNNHIGIPLTLLKVKQDAEIVVIEMGANHQKEIEGYCLYALPTHGLITNAEKAHLEGFGGIEGVRKGKGELFDFLRKTSGIAFVMWDYLYLREMSRGIHTVITYGTTDANITGDIVQSEPLLIVKVNGEISELIIQTQLVGDYNLPNVLAAVTIGHYFKVPDEMIKNAIENYSPSNSRSQLIERSSNKIILDAYNANPTSMKAAIENFANIRAANKILMLGGMAELGNESLEEHKNIVQLIGRYIWKDVVLVGGDFMRFDHPYTRFENATQAGLWLLQQNLQNSYLLIKGSRSMQMEKVLDSLHS